MDGANLTKREEKRPFNSLRVLAIVILYAGCAGQGQRDTALPVVPPPTPETTPRGNDGEPRSIRSSLPGDPSADAGQSATADAGAPVATALPPGHTAEDVVRWQIFPRAKACYQDALRTDAHVYGKAVVVLHVSGSGEVDRIEAVKTDPVLPAMFTSCLGSAVRAGKFEPTDAGGARLSIPFNFRLPDR